MIDDFANRRVTVMGLGGFGGGVGVTRWLVGRGASVTVTDLAEPEKLAESLAAIADLDVTLHLGGHEEADFRDADLLVVNPAVPPNVPFLQVARDAGVPITTEVNLFVERCPATCVGVTGSVGKSTITAMTGHVLENAQRERRVWVGGNIGRSLLDALPQMGRDDLVVLELSSFQLHWTPLVKWSPHVAVVTNITPNHLDWHGTFAAYVADKLNLLRFQAPARDVIVIEDVPDLKQHVESAADESAPVWRYTADADDLSAINRAGQRLRWKDVRPAIPGQHNRRNAAAALTVAATLGIDLDRAIAALGSFEGLPHRLRRVAIINGVTYYDDSKSTTPEAVITALNAIDGPILLILGGYDKRTDLTPAIEAAARRVKFTACIGQTGRGLAAALRARGAATELYDELTAAVAACQAHAVDGDVILLSPGCASWDMFKDYRDRGETFARCARGS